ncbi:flagellar biosynthesis protein FliZ [Chania multitudinisentens RB-25]|uniref:Flagellar biosynthesis protein FliZ n=1 Tax=Chania multitudinisentens RB-25 TaxID=1441930 RepID=W0LDZ4_9GAMM|nr:flagella biosynthesis regulatory protein FliZ [Chania multitudinisentens]AHG22073.1 flagellar biosynthesis protein FliZ [Chania multitudinisentens RB-25]
MPGLLLKKRPLSRYLKDYKHSQTHCFQCGKLLDRMALVFRGKVINKEAIARMDQPIDDDVWLNVQNELVALCRFCSEIAYNSNPSYFDIMAFKQYLFGQTEMSHSTIREYVVRLRRLDEMLVAHNYPADTFANGGNAQRTIDDLSSTLHSNYRIALRKYEQYLAWQKS